MYIAQRPCTFAGVPYRIGETIPESAILPEAVDNLISYGVIAKSNTPNQQAEEITTISIPIYGDDDSLEVVDLSPKEVVQAMGILQQTVADAEKQIADIHSKNLLKIIQRLDSRKGVKDAASKRGDTILDSEQSPQGGESEQSEETPEDNAENATEGSQEPPKDGE